MRATLARSALVAASAAMLGACLSDDSGDPERCPPPSTACGRTCVNLLSDNLHCGTCANACGGGTACVQGVCTTACAAGFVACAGTCVDPQRDALHCGVGAGCTGGAVCTNGDSCFQGTCSPLPAGAVPVDFVVDDTANQLFGPGELAWKGSMLYDPTTRIVTLDATWSGPWPILYDDGAWALGGHEPAGAAAGDHRWGVTVFAVPPATGSTSFDYGLTDLYYESTFGNGWMWPGMNGMFTVAAGATAAIAAPGLVIAPAGTNDLRLTLDKNNLDTTGTWSTTTVKVKGSAWGWSEIALADDGTRGDATAADGTYTFVLSSWAGAGKPYRHTGLLNRGATAQFIWVLDGVEYKLANGNAATSGLTAGTRASSAASFTAVPINILADKTSAITVP